MSVSASMQLVPTGCIKTFGSLGPQYEVGEPIRKLPDGDWLVQVVLVDSGEKIEYSLAHIQSDPLSH